MSLLELMLVLAVLSVIAAISFPAMRRNMGRADVTSAARQLQQQLHRARLEAMESAETFLFLPKIDSNSFFLGPLSVFQQRGADLDLRLIVDPNGDQSSPSAWVHLLPLPMRFVQSTESSLTDPQAINDRSIDAPSSQPSLDAVWERSSNASDVLAEAVLFYPNGRIQSATIAIASDDGYHVAVEIEGLAGRINIGPITRENLEELKEFSNNDRVIE